MKIGFIEPHLQRYGGIRRVVEFGNRLVERGHDVTFFVGEQAEPACTWMSCAPRVVNLPEGVNERFDVLLFNHEPQWHLLGLFEHVRVRAFYALHYARLYGKAGSWEALRASVDLLLANSTWTAERIEEEAGRRPEVVLSGINTAHFRPVVTRKEYPVLAVGDRRAWKGHGTIVRAACLLGLPLETYAGKDLPQERMAEEYAKAEVFVVGSDFEGFGQPGLEALACGVPLVTTDNGGCRDYALHEETALVVPPGDPEAMAQAVARLRRDPALAQRLRDNGLRLAAERFDWERATDRFEGLLAAAVNAAPEEPRPFAGLDWKPPEPARLTVVVLAWDGLPLTQDCVESVRQRTDVPYELVIVDNGSGWEAANYARWAADSAVLNDRNLGFAYGMNQGLEAARGEHVAFANNDTVLPEGWASKLVSHLADPEVGIVVPAVTNARDPRIVREEPGEAVDTLLAFETPPPAVLYVTNRDLLRQLGGFGEEYEIASGEDMDLCFKVWVNDLRVVFDSRVLVDHVSKGTAEVKLEDWRSVWARNRRVFLDKWQDPALEVPRLKTCPPELFARNLRVARAVAGWMERFFVVLDRKRELAAALAPPPPPEPAPPRPPVARRLVRGFWRLLRPLVPLGLRRRMFAVVRTQYFRYFPERR